MMRISLIGLLVATVFAADGVDRWRDGDRAYRLGDYEGAVEAYSEALNRMSPDNPRRFRVQSNLGAALHALGRHEEARDAYRRAALFARSDAEQSRAAYNAGTIALAMADYGTALQLLREAVMSDRGNEDAKHNLELALRFVPPDEQGGSMMPSEDQRGEGDDSDEEQSGTDGDDEGEADDEEESDDGQDADANEDRQDDPSEEDGQERPDAPSGHEPALSREQAERILQALEAGEQEALRHVRQADAPQRRIERDW